MYTRRETWVYRGNSAGNRVENGRGQIKAQTWQNHTFWKGGKKDVISGGNGPKIDSQPGTVAGEAPPGAEHPSVHLFSLQGGVWSESFLFLTGGNTGED